MTTELVPVTSRPSDFEIAEMPIPPSTMDDQLVDLWLYGRSPHTIRAYRDDVAAFRAFTGKSLRATYLSDLQRYADALTGAPATRARRLKALTSLLSFAARMGYMAFNIGAAIWGPKVEQKLAERILTERQVFRDDDTVSATGGIDVESAADARMHHDGDKHRRSVGEGRGKTFNRRRARSWRGLDAEAICARRRRLTSHA